MRVGFTDGEMSGLKADFGQLLCACICEYQPKPPYFTDLQTFQLRDYVKKRWDDKSLAVAWRDAMEKYDIIVTWNGIKFDVPFLNTRLERWGLHEVRVKRHKDLMYTARYKLRLSNNRLDTVAKFYNCPVKKTTMEPGQWTMAMGGHRPAYDYIIAHCKLDVAVLAWVWEKAKKHVTEIK